MPCVDKFSTELRIIQFAKAPVAGRVKTRLAVAIGDDRACAVHQQLVEHTLSNLVGFRLGSVELHSDDVMHKKMIALARCYHARLKPQHGDTLGCRMHNAFSKAFVESPNTCVVLVGSDCPAISKGYIYQAVNALSNGSDVVFGPANDGGYVLVGLKRAEPLLFEKVDWGSDKVLQQSITAAETAGFSVGLFEALSDIDRPQDLASLAAYGIDY